MANVVAPRRRTSVPAAVSNWAGGRIVTLALLAVTAWAVWSVVSGPAWRVQWVEVIGCQYVSADLVVQAGALADAWSVSLVPEDVAARVRGLPAVLDAQVEVTGPSRVRITVHEDPPVVELHAGERDYWISAAGRVSEATASLPSLPTVVVAGEWKATAASDVLSGLRALRAAFPEQQQFDYDAAHGYVLTSSLGCPVYVGNAGDLGRQLAALTALEAELGARGVKPEYVSLVSVEGAYYR